MSLISHVGRAKYNLFISGLTFIVLSSLFIIGYVYIDYHNYISEFRSAQKAELDKYNFNLEKILTNVKNLSELTATRLSGSNGDLRKIQNIINSVQALSNEIKIPTLQIVSYNKVSEPQAFLNRFGQLHFQDKEFTLDSENLSKAYQINIKDNAFIVKRAVFNLDEKLEGILGFSINIEDLKEFLGPFKYFNYTLGIEGLKTLKSYQDMVTVSLYAPQTFSDYVHNKINNYFTFILFIIFALFFMGIHTMFMVSDVHKSYRREIGSLKGQLEDEITNSKKVTESYILLQNEEKCLKTAVQSQQKLLSRLIEWQKARAQVISRWLMYVKESLNKLDNLHRGKELDELLEVSLGFTNAISNVNLDRLNPEEINLSDLIHSTVSLFADKINTSNILVDIDCPKDLSFNGIMLFVELLLANIFIRSLHGAPKNSQVQIIACKTADNIEISIRDNNAFSLSRYKDQIQKSLWFFIDNHDLQNICYEKDIHLEFSKQDNNLNVTILKIFGLSEKNFPENVIPIRKK